MSQISDQSLLYSCSLSKSQHLPTMIFAILESLLLICKSADHHYHHTSCLQHLENFEFWIHFDNIVSYSCPKMPMKLID